jgi:hypothetical protein
MKGKRVYGKHASRCTLLIRAPFPPTSHTMRSAGPMVLPVFGLEPTVTTITAYQQHSFIQKLRLSRPQCGVDQWDRELRTVGLYSHITGTYLISLVHSRRAHGRPSPTTTSTPLPRRARPGEHHQLSARRWCTAHDPQKQSSPKIKLSSRPYRE